MTLAERSTHVPAVQECMHDARAVCIWCSDQVSWWREARGGGDPPNARRLEDPAPTLIAIPCVGCGREVIWPVDDDRQPRHPHCHYRRKVTPGLTIDEWKRWYRRQYGRRIA